MHFVKDGHFRNQSVQFQLFCLWEFIVFFCLFFFFFFFFFGGGGGCFQIYRTIFLIVHPILTCFSPDCMG